MSENQDEIAARRFFMLNAIRITGAIMIAIGLAIIANGFAGMPMLFGVVLLVFGILEFIVAPVFLARAWKSKND